MKNKEKAIELLEEAKDLIIEYYEEEKILCDGENQLEYINISEDGTELILKEKKYEDKEYYDLTDISSKLEFIEYFEALDFAKMDASDKYKKMNKEEYIQYVGSLYYLDERVKEIYERLQEIEREAEKIEE